MGRYRDQSSKELGPGTGETPRGRAGLQPGGLAPWAGLGGAHWCIPCTMAVRTSAHEDQRHAFSLTSHVSSRVSLGAAEVNEVTTLLSFSSWAARTAPVGSLLPPVKDWYLPEMISISLLKVNFNNMQPGGLIITNH